MSRWVLPTGQVLSVVHSCSWKDQPAAPVHWRCSALLVLVTIPVVAGLLMRLVCSRASSQWFGGRRHVTPCALVDMYLSFSTLLLEATGFSETSTYIYPTAWRYTLEEWSPKIVGTSNFWWENICWNARILNRGSGCSWVASFTPLPALTLRRCLCYPLGRRCDPEPKNESLLPRGIEPGFLCPAGRSVVTEPLRCVTGTRGTLMTQSLALCA